MSKKIKKSIGRNITNDELAIVKEYDERGNIISVIIYGDNGVVNTTVLHTYDEHNNITYSSVESANDKDEHILSYEYNDAGNIIEKRDAVGNAIAYTYDETGKIVQTSRFNDEPIVKFTYSDKGDLISTISDLEKYEYIYDDNGNCINEYHLTYDENCNDYVVCESIQREFDENNHIVRCIANEIISSYTYDINGNVIYEVNTDIIDPDSESCNTVNFTYNDNNELIQETFSASNYMRISYYTHEYFK